MKVCLRYIYIIVPEGKQKMELERPVTPIDVLMKDMHQLLVSVVDQRKIQKVLCTGIC
jgi:hypothetical protein